MEPTWASELVGRVCADYGHPRPALRWWRRHGANRGHGSSGRATPTENHIHVSAGSSRKDQKLVLLHELAHLLVPAGEHHSAGFWNKAFELYARYGVPMAYARERERGYRVGAEKAYQRYRKLRRPVRNPVPKQEKAVAELAALRVARKQQLLKSWLRKAKLAETKIRKINRSIRGIESWMARQSASASA